MKGFDEEHATALGELIFSMVDVGKIFRTSILLTDLMQLSSICEKKYHKERDASRSENVKGSFRES